MERRIRAGVLLFDKLLLMMTMMMIGLSVLDDVDDAVEGALPAVATATMKKAKNDYDEDRVMRSDLEEGAALLLAAREAGAGLAGAGDAGGLLPEPPDLAHELVKGLVDVLVVLGAGLEEGDVEVGGHVLALLLAHLPLVFEIAVRRRKNEKRRRKNENDGG
jgi:hypothetical protein